MNKQLTVKDAAPKKRRRKIASLDKRKARAGWLFILPFLAVFVTVYLPIVIDSLKYSVSKLTILSGGGYVTEFVFIDCDIGRY